MLLLIFASALVARSSALIVEHGRFENATSHAVAQSKQLTFQSYYASVADGPGIWKWNNALDAYQRHFAYLTGQPASIAEVGVQSGGSLGLWRTVLGNQIKLHGLDINPECKQFEQAGTDITIGDQGDWNMWKSFFAKIATGLDILVDDGSHEAHHMVATFYAAYPQIKPGGFIAMEDIHGPWYLDTFFKPVAKYLAAMDVSGQVHSVHLYPQLLVVRKAGPNVQEVMAYNNIKTNAVNLQEMWAAIGSAPPGTQIRVQNPEWKNMFHADALGNFFSMFNDLHASAFVDAPVGCATTTAPVCTNAVSPLSYLQSRVTGVHIYSDHVIIEVPATAPVINAVRKGTYWIGYGF